VNSPPSCTAGAGESLARSPSLVCSAPAGRRLRLGATDLAGLHQAPLLITSTAPPATSIGLALPGSAKATYGTLPSSTKVIVGNNGGLSSYNSAQFTLTHRARNATAILNYTFSKPIDNASGRRQRLHGPRLTVTRSRRTADAPTSTGPTPSTSPAVTLYPSAASSASSAMQTASSTASSATGPSAVS
jgi:hypothetical protein